VERALEGSYLHSAALHCQLPLKAAAESESESESESENLMMSLNEVLELGKQVANWKALQVTVMNGSMLKLL